MLSIFGCGFLGSLSVELIFLLQHFQSETPLPSRYSKPLFWIVRTLLAVVAGGLALAYDIDKPLLAINIGAATPLIIRAFAEGVKDVGLPVTSAPATKSRKVTPEPAEPV